MKPKSKPGECGNLSTPSAIFARICRFETKRGIFMNLLFPPRAGKMCLLVCVLLVHSTLSLAQKKAKLEPASYPTAEAIKQLEGLEDTLGVLGYAIVNDSIEVERFAACKVFITTLVRTLKIENSFKYPFEQLRTVSILTPPDSSFRIFTWQLFVNDSTYRYYGSIQMNEKKLHLHPLIDRSFDMEIFPSNESLTSDRWYGALYYNIRQFDTRQGRKYLLIGYDAFEFFEKRKLLDVLSFDANDKPVFGAAVFEHEDDLPRQRAYIQYSADAIVRLNWDQQYEMVLMDHLIPLSSPYGRGTTSVPDGSYDAYKLEKGRWKYFDKVFDDKQEEVPYPEPILDTRKDKDILGKKKKTWGWQRGKQ